MEQNTSAEVTTEAVETSYYDVLGEKNFDGKTLSIIGVDYATRRNFPNEEEAGEVVNDALAERDSFITEKYNAEIKYSKYEKSRDINPIILNEVLSNENNDHVVISSIGDTLKPLLTGNALYDLSKVPYIDLTAAWWSPFVNENTRINDSVYITIGDISPQKYYAPYALAFNKKLAENNHFPDLYSMVLDGTWDIDEFGKLTKETDRDLDGDGDIDQLDFWGYAHVNTKIMGLSHFIGAGGEASSYNGNEVVVDLNNEKAAGIVQKLQSVISKITYSDMNETTTMFVEDRALFYGNSMSNIIANFRNMESDYGLVPTPKFDEKQENYYSYINTFALGETGVPLTCSDIEFTGFMMEALCYKSYETVRPALFENLIKEKVSRDAQSSQILDIIYDNTYLDLNGIFDFGGSNTFVGLAIAENNEYVSGIAAIEEAIKADITKNIEALG